MRVPSATSPKTNQRNDQAPAGVALAQGEPVLVKRSVRIEVDLYVRLKELARQHRRNLTQELNAALAHYVNFLARGQTDRTRYAE